MLDSSPANAHLASLTPTSQNACAQWPWRSSQLEGLLLHPGKLPSPVLTGARSHVDIPAWGISHIFFEGLMAQYVLVFGKQHISVGECLLPIPLNSLKLAPYAADLMIVADVLGRTNHEIPTLGDVRQFILFLQFSENPNKPFIFLCWNHLFEQISGHF